jgi:hypothetical protein
LPLAWLRASPASPDARPGGASPAFAAVGAPRLADLGLRLPPPLPAPEHRLYARLAADDPDAARSRYNALVRCLVSFERAAECAS